MRIMRDDSDGDGCALGGNHVAIDDDSAIHSPSPTGPFTGPLENMFSGLVGPQNRFSRLRAKIKSPRLETNSFPISAQRSTNTGDCRPAGTPPFLHMPRARMPLL